MPCVGTCTRCALPMIDAAKRLHAHIQSLGRSRVLIIVAMAMLACLLLAASLRDGPPPAPVSHAVTTGDWTEEPPVKALIALMKKPETQRVLLITAAAVVVLLLVLFTLGIGAISLSAQSLAHRRNVMFAFSLILLSEVFAIDIGATLGIKSLGSPSSSGEVEKICVCLGCPATEKDVALAAAYRPCVHPRDDAATTSTAPSGKDKESTRDINRYAYGVLGFFLIYSFIEYCFTFASDYMRTREAGRRNVRTAFGGPAIFVIGLYRLAFDILIPALAFTYVMAFFAGPAKEFAIAAKNAIVCKHPEVRAAPEESLARLGKILDDIEQRFPDAKHAVADARLALEATASTSYATQSQAWLSCTGERP